MKNVRKELRKKLLLRILESSTNLTLSEITRAVELHKHGWSFSSGTREGNSYKTLHRDLVDLNNRNLIGFHGHPRRYFRLANFYDSGITSFNH